MPVAKKTRKEKIEKEKEETEKKEPYFFAVGRRKTSVAQIRLYSQKNSKENEISVNSRIFLEYFPTQHLQNIFLSPLKLTGIGDNFRVSTIVKGGGIKGQADACRLGIARALVKYSADFKKTLKDAGFLKRDARIVERKKAGLKKARRAPQWAKR